MCGGAAKSRRLAAASSVRTALAGEPMISEWSGKVLPSVTSARAPTRQPPPIRAPLSTTAPMPISEPSPIDAAMQDRAVADRAVLADLERGAHVGVQRDEILDVGARADDDRLIVAAQNRAEPYADVAPEPERRRSRLASGAIQ